MSCVGVSFRIPGSLVGNASPSFLVKVIVARAVVLKATLVALDTRLPASSSATTQTVYAVDSLRLGVGETTTVWATFATTVMLLPLAAEPDTVPALIAEADGTPAVNTHALVAPVTPPAVLAAVHSALDAVAAAQLAFDPPGLTAQVLPRFVKSTT